MFDNMMFLIVCMLNFMYRGTTLVVKAKKINKPQPARVEKDKKKEWAISVSSIVQALYRYLIRF